MQDDEDKRETEFVPALARFEKVWNATRGHLENVRNNVQNFRRDEQQGVQDTVNCGAIWPT